MGAHLVLLASNESHDARCRSAVIKFAWKALFRRLNSALWDLSRPSNSCSRAAMRAVDDWESTNSYRVSINSFAVVLAEEEVAFSFDFRSAASFSEANTRRSR